MSVGVLAQRMMVNLKIPGSGQGRCELVPCQQVFILLMMVAVVVSYLNVQLGTKRVDANRQLESAELKRHSLQLRSSVYEHHIGRFQQSLPETDSPQVEWLDTVVKLLGAHSVSIGSVQLSPVIQHAVSDRQNSVEELGGLAENVPIFLEEHQLSLVGRVVHEGKLLDFVTELLSDTTRTVIAKSCRIELDETGENQHGHPGQEPPFRSGSGLLYRCRFSLFQTKSASSRDEYTVMSATGNF